MKPHFVIIKTKPRVCKTTVTAQPLCKTNISKIKPTRSSFNTLTFEETKNTGGLTKIKALRNVIPSG